LSGAVPGSADLPPQQITRIARFASATLAGLVLDRLFALALAVLMSAALGASRQLDDYLLSVVGPILITGLLGDVLYTVLLPELISAPGQLAARETSWNLLCWTAAGLALATAAYALVWAGSVVLAGQGGGRLLMLGLVTSPVILFGGIGVVGSTALVARRRYALATARIPLASLTALFAFLVWTRFSSSVIGLAFSVLAGWAVSAAFTVGAVIVVSGTPQLTMSPSGAVGLLRRLAGPSLAQLVAGVASQVPTPIERLIAFPLGAGVLSSLNYGRILVSPPLLIAQSIATASYPQFLNLKAVGGQGSYNALGRLIGLMVFLLLPLTVLFAGLAHPLVELVYHRGAFDQQAVTRTTVAAAILAGALVPIATGAVLTRFLYAERSSRQVARASLAALVAYVALALSLGVSFGYVGLAAASTGFYVVLTTILLLIVGRASPNGLRFVPGGSILRALAAAALMAGVGVLSDMNFSANTGFITQLAHVLVTSVFAMLVYFLVSLVLRSAELTDVVAVAKRAIPKSRASTPGH
jgi:putative peptidoglycan lipid II flippase